MNIDLSDYQTVDERIREFYEKHPKGALRRIGDPVPWTFGERAFIAYTAGAWRDATTVDPDGMGTAWEPVPGPTQFTKDSELMNAETAAWGRAIIACGAATAKKGISSQEEIRNRSGNGKPAQAPAANNTDTSWEIMNSRLLQLRERGLLPMWATNAGYPKMNAAMWAALTLPNQKICFDAARDLLPDEQAVAS